MDPEQNQSSPKSSSSGLITGLIILLLVAASGYLLLKNKPFEAGNPTTSPATEETAQNNSGTQEKTESPDTSSPSASLTPPAVAGALNVEGGSFYFRPNVITAKLGQPLTITFNNTEGVHNLVIDEFSVTTKTITGGKTDSVTFTPDKKGTFEFYCSLGNHRQQGMVGQLIVQ